MPRPRIHTPTYRRHKPTGMALSDFRDPVTGEKKCVTLGPWQSPQSRKEHARLCSELATGKSVGTTGLTVAELAFAYLQHAERYYVKNGKQTDEVDAIRSSLRALRETHAHTEVGEFTPRALVAVQNHMIGLDWTRRTINKQIARVRRAFRWGVAVTPATIRHTSPDTRTPPASHCPESVRLPKTRLREYGVESSDCGGVVGRRSGGLAHGPSGPHAVPVHPADGQPQPHGQSDTGREQSERHHHGRVPPARHPPEDPGHDRRADGHRPQVTERAAGVLPRDAGVQIPHPRHPPRPRQRHPPPGGRLRHRPTAPVRGAPDVRPVTRRRPLPPGRILVVVVGQHRVQVRVSHPQRAGLLEERLTRHGEELGRILRPVAVQHLRVAVLDPATHGGRVPFAARPSFSPDGRRVACAVESPQGRFVKVWDAASGRELLALRSFEGGERGLSNLPHLVAFSPDGHRLLEYVVKHQNRPDTGTTARNDVIDVTTWDASPREGPKSP